MPKSPTRRSEHLSGHPRCEKAGRHICIQPSSRFCIMGCGRAAGTLWGPYWCPDCDSIRMGRIKQQLEDMHEFGDAL